MLPHAATRRSPRSTRRRSLPGWPTSGPTGRPPPSPPSGRSTGTTTTTSRSSGRAAASTRTSAASGRPVPSASKIRSRTRSSSEPARRSRRSTPPATAGRAGGASRRHGAGGRSAGASGTTRWGRSSPATGSATGRSPRGRSRGSSVRTGDPDRRAVRAPPGDARRVLRLPVRLAPPAWVRRWIPTATGAARSTPTGSSKRGCGATGPPTPPPVSARTAWRSSTARVSGVLQPPDRRRARQRPLFLERRALPRLPRTLIGGRSVLRRSSGEGGCGV
jgi:hypothetical protein